MNKHLVEVDKEYLNELLRQKHDIEALKVRVERVEKAIESAASQKKSK